MGDERLINNKIRIMPEGEKPENMREVYPALIVEVCEGDGDSIPYRIVRYVVIDGKKFGYVESLNVLKRHW